MIFHRRELNATWVDWFLKHSVFMLVKFKKYVCIYFVEVLDICHNLSARNLIHFKDYPPHGRRVSLFMGKYFMLKCYCNCKCNFCWAFIITLKAKNVVQRKYCGHKKWRKILRQLRLIFCAQPFQFLFLRDF